MTGISTGTGLISGIDTATLIEQLIAIESRPKVLAINRQIQLQSEQSAFLGLNSLLLSLGSAAAKFASEKIFDTKLATSSDATKLTAAAGADAQPGVYDFLVHRLVTTSQFISKGFADSDATGLGMEEISFEYGHGALTTDVELAALNGGNGVARGKIEITDTAGQSAVIDLSTAVTVNDALEAINDSTEVGVTASISSDGSGITITDTAGGAGTLRIDNVTGYTTATDLGIAGTDGDADDRIVGSRINALGWSTALSTLNDGNGVRIANNGLGITDFRITTRDGMVHNIVLGERDLGGGETESAVTNLEGIKDRIEEITGGDVTLQLGADGQGLTLTDNTAGVATFEITAGTGGTGTAEDLGIFKAADGGSPGTIAGDKIVAGLNSVLTKSLNGGSGLSGATTLTITDRAGNTDTFALDPDSSLSDIVAQINASATLNITAGFNRAGNGLSLTDDVGGAGNLIITGDAATALGIATDPLGVAVDSIDGDNLQLQYVSEATLLSDLNYGQGVGTGVFRITDAEGNQATVDIGSDARTLADVIDEINATALEINARINDSGDGIVIESTADTPTLKLKVETVSGSTARDLRILGEAADVLTDNFIDGSYEDVVDLETTDTLDDVVSKVNAAGLQVTASILNNGTGINPFHVTFTSKISGSEGQLLIDTGAVDWGFDALNEGQDAVVFFGSEDPADAILLTSSTNTLDDAITGVSIDLLAESDTPVTLSITSDTIKIVDTVKGFVTAFNAVVTRIHELGKYDAETETKGVLLGNSTIRRIESQLYRTLASNPTGVSPQYETLSEVGLNVGEGGMLELDEERFREALAEDPEAVAELFAAKKLAPEQENEIEEGVTVDPEDPIYEELGVVEMFNVLAKDLTNSIDGTLTIVNQNYDAMIELQTKRIEAFDARLEDRREYLTRQFAAMETALASLQAQQAALSSIATVG